MLGLLSHSNGPWIWRPESRWQPFLHAALACWNELDAVGARYYTAVQGRPLWQVPNNLHYVLANMGVPAETLRAPLPPDGPAALLRYTARPQ